MEENTSGKGEESIVPQEIMKWNWGAFIFSWLWGIRHSTYRALWIFFPPVGFFMLFALGFKGSEWAWKHTKWQSIKHFQQVQRKWAKAGAIFTLCLIPLIFAFFLVINIYIKDSEPYRLSFGIASTDPEVISIVGTPIGSGFVTGNMQTSGPDGEANLSYDIKGPNGSATVFVNSVMKMGKWSINCLEVEMPNNSRKVIVECEKSIQYL